MNIKKYLSLTTEKESVWSLSLSLTLTILIILSINFNVFSQSKTQATKSERPTVGLVLSGGGAKGFAYIGLLKVIQEAGLRIDYIGGTSIGSIMAGLYAIGYHPDSIAAMIREQNWDHLLKDEIDRKYIAYNEKEFGEKSLIVSGTGDKSFTKSLFLIGL
jgi:NTE family protein